jgi:hypothetical protein
MKLYEYKYEEDGKTVKAPGVSETEIKTCSLYYAAESEEAVWAATADLRYDPEKRFRSIAEVLPLVMVLPTDPTSGSNDG